MAVSDDDYSDCPCGACRKGRAAQAQDDRVTWAEYKAAFEAARPGVTMATPVDEVFTPWNRAECAAQLESAIRRNIAAHDAFNARLTEPGLVADPAVPRLPSTAFDAHLRAYATSVPHVDCQCAACTKSRAVRAFEAEVMHLTIRVDLKRLEALRAAVMAFDGEISQEDIEASAVTHRVLEAARELCT